jgi:hypothetical protein
VKLRVPVSASTEQSRLLQAKTRNQCMAHYAVYFR